MSNNYFNFLPGFCMGVTRSIISHPFEIMKIKTQLKVNKNINLFAGLHYSIIASGLERGTQFYLYDFFRSNGDSNFLSACKSSALSTIIGIPYNFLMVNKSVSNKKIGLTLNKLYKTIPLEYSRCFLGSSIFLYTYNELKQNNIPMWLSAFGGTTIVWGVTYPIDNIRNQIISNNNNFSITNFYRGVQYPILRSLPSSIVGMYVYEKVKNFINII